jgi:arylsulfatase A-like enzyme
VQFHLLTFEGPDPYAQAGGIASRVTGLAHALAEAGYATHLLCPVASTVSVSRGS